MKELLFANVGVKSVEEIILESIRLLQKNELEEGKIPVNIQRIAALRKILKIELVEEDFFRKIRGYKDKQFDACLMPVPGGFKVMLSKSYDTRHRRYSLAHEIIHTFFYDIDSDIPQRITVLDHEVEERICNSGAAELLMPSGLFSELFKQLNNMETTVVIKVKKLADTFDVSYEAVARRLVEKLLLSQQLIITKWRFMDKGGYGKSDYRLDWYVSSNESLPRLFEESRLKDQEILNYLPALTKEWILTFSRKEDRPIKLGNSRCKGVDKIELLRLDNHMFFPSFLMVLHFSSCGVR